MSTQLISPRLKRTLFCLLIANVVATIFHYTDNVCYFHLYPEPTWLNAKIVDAFWFVMTPLALIGYLLIRREHIRRGCLFLYAYATASLLVLGHYRFAPFFLIPFRIHLFILLEAALAFVLILYVAWIRTRCDRPSA
ncbi:MAG: hypothetical protein M3N48_09820 [Verrucomicrobiota bacterium]|nr:hypothetical protein [Verrucomicrobiota bacterium]